MNMIMIFIPDATNFVDGHKFLFGDLCKNSTVTQTSFQKFKTKRKFFDTKQTNALTNTKILILSTGA